MPCNRQGFSFWGGIGIRGIQEWAQLQIPAWNSCGVSASLCPSWEAQPGPAPGAAAGFWEIFWRFWGHSHPSLSSPSFGLPAGIPAWDGGRRKELFPSCFQAISLFSSCFPTVLQLFSGSFLALFQLFPSCFPDYFPAVSPAISWLFSGHFPAVFQLFCATVKAGLPQSLSLKALAALELLCHRWALICTSSLGFSCREHFWECFCAAAEPGR